MRWLGLLFLSGCLLVGGESGTNNAAEGKFLSHVRQLVFDGHRSGEGYFSRRGDRIVFQSEREPGNPFYQIYTLNLLNGERRLISPGIGKTTCAFIRPDDRWILFSSTHLDPDARAKQKDEIEFRASGKQRRYSWDYDENMDLFAVSQDSRPGTPPRRLTDSPGYDAEGSYSPDGKWIVFCSLRSAYPTNALSPELKVRLQNDPAWFGEIYLMKSDGSDVRRLTDWAGYDGGPFFSPNGRRIVWRHFSDDGTTADVYTMNLDGSDRRRITDFKSMSWAPYFHPSGKYIIFTSNKLGFSNFELFIVDAEGRSQPVQVTFTDGFDGLPVFSPEGNRLCWTSGRTSDGKSQLFIADWDHTAALRALEIPGGNADRRGDSTRKPEPGGGTAESLRANVEYLASDLLEGRLTGEFGAREASDFIAEKLEKTGWLPAGDRGSWFQNFEFTAGEKVAAGQNELSIGDSKYAVETDFRPLSFSANGRVQGEVVFAGYGLAVPGSGATGYDSYQGLDVSNKIALVLRYVPEKVSQERRQELNRYAGLRYKAMLAREHGARAILVVTGPNSPNAGELVPLSFDNSLSGSEILAASVSGRLAAALLAAGGKDLKSLQTALDDENPHAEKGAVLPGSKVSLKLGLERIRKTDRNVLAFLPPAEWSNGEYVMLGAHYDHLGRGQVGAFNHPGEENQIHNGADDNASGVSLLLELAKSMAAARRDSPGRPSRGILLAFWSGEEMGLIGSGWYAEHPARPFSNAVAYLNFDMVGRLRDERLVVQGTGSSDSWRRWIEKWNVRSALNLQLQDDPYLPTDTTSIYPKNVPVLNFFTGGHEQYHRPSDDAGTLNYEGLNKITRLAIQAARDLASSPVRPGFVKVQASDKGGGRETLRAYLGTIPDYTTEVKGLKLSGVRAGSPAEKGGLKGGDVIVQFGGKQISNIYDYTYALDAVKIGEAIKVTVDRDGQRVELSVTPEARK